MKNKAFVFLLAILLSSQAMIPVHASNVSTITQTGPVSVPLNATVASSFEVTVPKSVELTKGESKTFDIKVKGDIGGTENLTLNIGSTVTMSQEGKSDVTVPISLDKSTFSCANLQGEGSTSKVTVNGANLSAGSWTGSCSLTVSLN